MKLVVILLAVIALGGLVIGLGYAGVLYIPGISAVKKKAAKQQSAGNEDGSLDVSDLVDLRK